MVSPIVSEPERARSPDAFATVSVSLARSPTCWALTVSSSTVLAMLDAARLWVSAAAETSIASVLRLREASATLPAPARSPRMLVWRRSRSALNAVAVAPISSLARTGTRCVKSSEVFTRTMPSRRLARLSRTIRTSIVPSTISATVAPARMPTPIIIERRKFWRFSASSRVLSFALKVAWSSRADWSCSAGGRTCAISRCSVVALSAVPSASTRLRASR